MPIVVDEVVITVEVGGEPSAGAGPAPGAAQDAHDAQEIVRECVERVLEILAQREER